MKFKLLSLLLFLIMAVDCFSQNAYFVSGPESATIFTANGTLPIVGGTAFVGPQLTLPITGNYLIIGTIATTLKNASTATCWIANVTGGQNVQISPLTYAGSETPAVTTLWLPLTLVIEASISGSQTIQMECTNNAGHPELGPFVISAIQVSNVGS